MSAPPTTERRRHRRFTVLLTAFFLLCVVLHIYHRITDRRAWPEPAKPEDFGLNLHAVDNLCNLCDDEDATEMMRKTIAAVTNLSPSPIPARLTAPGATNAWHLLAALPVPYEDFPDVHHAAMREFAQLRAAGPAAATNATPALDDWIAKMRPALDLWHEAAGFAPEDSFCDSPDLPAQYAVLGKARECAILAPVLAARARRDGDWDRCATLWIDTLSNAPKVTFGTGSAGQIVAYDMTLGVTRDILAALPSMPSNTLSRVEEIVYNAWIGWVQPIDESIRHDGVAARAVLASFFPEDPASGPPPPGLNPPSGFFRWVARRNGSTPEASAAHFDAILSHVVVAAYQPYSAAGLYATLPTWCRGRRPPWTNDPAAAIAVCHLRDNTLSAGVYPVLREMEIMAVAYAIRLETLPKDAGEDAIRDAAFCAPGDSSPFASYHRTWDPIFRDPFSSNNAPFVLDAPPPHWRFHSVGPDQRDDGGTNDWATAKQPGPGLDFLFASPVKKY